MPTLVDAPHASADVGRASPLSGPPGPAACDPCSSGTGVVGLVFDAGDDLFRYRCSAFSGTAEGYLRERARLPTDVDGDRKDLALQALDAAA